jgi:hypothetical protein
MICPKHYKTRPATPARRVINGLPGANVATSRDPLSADKPNWTAPNRACPAGPFRVLVPFVYVPLQTPVPPNSPVERLVRLLDLLCAAIAARGAGGLLTVPLFFLLWRRVRHTAVRAIKVAARIAAGISPPAVRPRPASPRPSRPRPLRLPRGYAWVVRLVPGTAAYGTQLQRLLADPQMARLAEAPAMRRLLNPLRQMLGVPSPPPLPAPRPVVVTPKSAKPERDGGRNPAGCAPPLPAAPVAA